MNRPHRRPYPSDISDEGPFFVAPYLSVLPQTAAQRRHDLREVFNAVRYIVRTGAPWRWLPTNFPPWEAVYRQTRRWIAAGCFEAIVQDLRLLVRTAAGRRPQPSVAICRQSYAALDGGEWIACWSGWAQARPRLQVSIYG
jgi:transposase